MWAEVAGEESEEVTAAGNHLLWMLGSAWRSAASAGLVAVINEPRSLRWFLVFAAVFNGLFAIYWAMMTVAEKLQRPSSYGSHRTSAASR